MRRILLILLMILAVPAPAAVTLTFYSKELGDSFPHAFVLVTGATDADPAHLVDANYGFTARSVTPAILMGPVHGEIMGVKDGYIRNSQAHLMLTLTDAQYAAVLATVEKWRTLPGKSYDLNHRNCVFFVGDVARTLGMKVEDRQPLMKKPRSYLEDLVRLNPGVGTVPHDTEKLTPAATPQAAEAVPHPVPVPVH